MGHDLPRGYYKKLPKLANGPLAGYPRVFALALEIIAHTDSSLDEAHITRFVQAYQSVAPLTIGELWAVPIMLRLGLLENLRRLSRQMIGAWDDRSEAESWKDYLVACKDREHTASDRLLLDPAKQPRLPVVRFLRGPSAASAPRPRSRSARRNRMARAPRRQPQRCHRRCGAPRAPSAGRQPGFRRQQRDQSAVGCQAALDWSVFFEQTSVVEAELRKDPAGIYARQDFESRDRYRRRVEQLARGSKCSELDVAKWAIELARQAGSADAAVNHCGYYLIGPGRARLTAEVAYRPKWSDVFRESLHRHGEGVYFGSLLTLTALLVGLGWCYSLVRLPANPARRGAVVRLC